MSLESSEVRVFGSGHVYVAPVGTAFPTNISTAVSHAAGWREVGYITEEGARFSFAREKNDIGAWQSFDPIRTIVTRVPKVVAFDLMQWNQFTLQLALGGGTVTGSDPNYVYEPPDESFIDERALIIEATDGDFDYRFCYRKAVNQAPVDWAWVREDSANFPIEMQILAADDGAKPYLIQTNDDNVGTLTLSGS